MNRHDRNIANLEQEGRARKHDNRAVITLSIGYRPFFADICPSMRAYSERVGAQLLVKQFPEVTADHKKLLASAPEFGQKKMSQLLKLFYVRDTLSEFDRVLLLDDSCYVSHDCPDIFQAHGGPELGGVEDGGTLGTNSADGRIVNTGVLLFGQQQREFLGHLEVSIAAAEKWVPDQALINNAIHAGALKIRWLNWRFNVVGSQIRHIDELEEKPWIYHLTSGLPTDKRISKARQLRTERA